MPLYHYTDRITLEEIRSSGVLRANKQTLYRSLLGANDPDHQPWGEVGPIVWLTINPILDMTVVMKLLVAGWPQTLIGDIGRVVLPDGYAGDIGLWEYIQAKLIDPDWWEWVIRTGSMVGSNYTTWRLVDHDIPAADWLGCEILAGFTGQGTTWRKVS